MATALDRYAEMKPTWFHPVVIESHINGVRTKEMNPHTPISYEEIADDAIRCWEAGAGAIHAHNSSFDLLGENAYKDYMRTWDQVLARHPGITWYPTTCNNLRLLPHENGLEHVPLLHDHANVRIGCVDTGLTLFATAMDNEGYLSGPEFGFNYQRVASQVRMFKERDLAMVFGVYEPGHLRHAMHYVNNGLSTQGSMCDSMTTGWSQEGCISAYLSRAVAISRSLVSAQRNWRKKVATSSTYTSGTSRGAKCPPSSCTRYCWRLKYLSVQVRGGL